MNMLIAVAVLEMMNVAHRGLWKEANLPQNTVESIKAAYDAGARVVETDFVLTDAGEIISLHDCNAFASMFAVAKEPRQITPEDRAKIDLGAKAGLPRPYRIPLLEEVMAVVPKDRVLQSEIKVYGPDYARRFDAAVKAAGLVETNIIVSAFDNKALADFHRQYPRYVTLWLGCGVGRTVNVEKILAKAKAGGFTIVCPGCAQAQKAGMTRADADRIRAAGFDFRLFGVNNPTSLVYAASLGASGFTCDTFKEAYAWAAKIPGVVLLPAPRP